MDWLLGLAVHLGLEAKEKEKRPSKPLRDRMEIPSRRLRRQTMRQGDRIVFGGELRKAGKVVLDAESALDVAGDGVVPLTPRQHPDDAL